SVHERWTWSGGGQPTRSSTGTVTGSCPGAPTVTAPVCVPRDRPSVATATANVPGVVTTAGETVSHGASVVAVAEVLVPLLIRTVRSAAAVSPGASSRVSRRGAVVRTGTPLRTVSPAEIDVRAPVEDVRRAVTVWEPSVSCQVSNGRAAPSFALPARSHGALPSVL